jgi:hypothetical protein
MPLNWRRGFTRAVASKRETLCGRRFDWGQEGFPGAWAYMWRETPGTFLQSENIETAYI